MASGFFIYLKRISKIEIGHEDAMHQILLVCSVEMMILIQTFFFVLKVLLFFRVQIFRIVFGLSKFNCKKDESF